MAKIIVLDSDYDDDTRAVAVHRRSSLYGKMKGPLTFLPKAFRAYLAPELMAGADFLSGSGHGNEMEFIGNDRNPLLETGGYNKQEAAGKIIHLLSCSTAYNLGQDLVNNGCKAFFGYDTLFFFDARYLDEFLGPDHAIDILISQGSTVAQAHHEAIRVYQETINKMMDKGVDSSIVGRMQTNLNHFCSAVTNPVWGSPEASLGQSSSPVLLAVNENVA